MSGGGGVGLGAAAAVGWLSWPLVEYAIHGWLSHRFRTFVSPLHWGHHRNPRAVFTSPVAWVPAAVVLYGLAAWLTSPAVAACGMAGLLAGFARYERVHWRIHFREPRSERERLLRAHHLAHHFVNPKAYHGVTTRFFDRLCGTLPDTAEADYARVAGRPPLRGASNLRDIWSVRGNRDLARRVGGGTEEKER